VGELTTFAGKFGHVHIVAHPRKGADETQVPGKMDVRGSGTLADLVHNGFTVWRNKTKEEKLQTLPAHDLAARVALEKVKDGQLSVWKQREGGEEPIRPLWLHRSSQQFLESNEHKPRIYFQP
jgi:twinkle protein